MKRLFQVNKPNGQPTEVVDTKGTIIGTYYASNKEDAKRVRDALNSKHPKGGYTVSPGPDHKGHLPKRTRGHRRANRTHNDRGN